MGSARQRWAPSPPSFRATTSVSVASFFLLLLFFFYACEDAFRASSGPEGWGLGGEFCLSACWVDLGDCFVLSCFIKCYVLDLRIRHYLYICMYSTKVLGRAGEVVVVFFSAWLELR